MEWPTVFVRYFWSFLTMCGWEQRIFFIPVFCSFMSFCLFDTFSSFLTGNAKIVEVNWSLSRSELFTCGRCIWKQSLCFSALRCLGARCLVSHVSASISQRPRRCPDNIICAFVNLHSLGQRNKQSTSFVQNLSYITDALPLNVQSCATGSGEQGMFDWFLLFLIRRLVACVGAVTTVTRQDQSEGDWVTHSLHWALYSLHPQ